MKLIFGLAFLLATASSWAQLPPPPAAPPRDAEKSLGAYAAQVPHGIPKAPPAAAQASNAELADLLRKQTAAIKALNAQVNELEGRIGKLERGAR